MVHKMVALSLSNGIFWSQDIHLILAQFLDHNSANPLKEYTAAFLKLQARCRLRPLVTSWNADSNGSTSESEPPSVQFRFGSGFEPSEPRKPVMKPVKMLQNVKKKNPGSGFLQPQTWGSVRCLEKAEPEPRTQVQSGSVQVRTNFLNRTFPTLVTVTFSPNPSLLVFPPCRCRPCAHGHSALPSAVPCGSVSDAESESGASDVFEEDENLTAFEHTMDGEDESTLTRDTADNVALDKVLAQIWGIPSTKSSYFV
ncbi:hypothetical protein GGX14DRAFT_398224 [Mycena pura]|uniref:Uncharacterized protein n=1 Tax=Mycena pura TaxID=153505 RepID=A0AAD6V6P0_9AGAR|nr:hypothetical protein GGX14DRAFT_398224 [Mycena pura]